ncbi:3-hydroxyacyl-CoA dehydrogenase NAD-binding domain-containing protein [Massilia sp. METH4]|uniref:3-hydroxyacyl-CoA dehydrogenase NAD-binding domain-containing protein n=1 Tax=Massilia sp. METH4 TaxID=3123041 RepID=UPI0030D21CF5
MTHHFSDCPATAACSPGSINAIPVDEPRRPSARRLGKAFSLEHGSDAGTHTLAAETLPVRRVGIMGANATGMELAMRLLAADIPVTVFDLAREPLDSATASLRSSCRQAFADGALTASQRDRRLALLAGTVNLHHLKDSEVIVDALDVGPDARDGLVRRLNEVARPDAVLMTRVAHVDRIAALTRYPANVLGCRLPDDGNARQPLELVPARGTSARALATAAGLVDYLHQQSDAGSPPVLS